MHDGNSVTEQFCFVQVMRGKDDGPVLLEPLDEAPDKSPGHWINSSRRLVQDHHLRSADERQAHAHATLETLAQMSDWYRAVRRKGK